MSENRGRELAEEKIKGIYGDANITKNVTYYFGHVELIVDYEIVDGPYLVWYLYRESEHDTYKAAEILHNLLKGYKVACKTKADFVGLIGKAVVLLYNPIYGKINTIVL